MNFKEINLEQKTDSWLRWRGGGITGTEASALAMYKLSLPHPFSNIRSLYLNRINGIEEEVFQNEHILRGVELEPVAEKKFYQLTGIKTSSICAESLSHPFVRGSLDGWSYSHNVGLEIKCPSNYSTWSEYDKIPEHYLWQVRHYQLMTLSDFYLFAYFNDDQYKLFRIKYNEEECSRLLSWEIEYHNSLKTGLWEGSKELLPKVLVLSGYATSGKDEVGKVLVDEFNYSKLAFADRLKTISQGVGFYDNAKKKTDRPKIVSMARFIREDEPDYFANIVSSQLGSRIFSDNKIKGVVVTDCRYLNEWCRVKKECDLLGVNAELVWIHNPEVGPCNDEERVHTSLLEGVADKTFFNTVDKDSDEFLNRVYNLL